MNQSAPTYSSFLAITVSYLFLPVILYLFIVAPSWHSLPNDLSMMAMLCALPAMVAAAVSGLVLDRNKVLDAEGKVSTSKIMTSALIVYALAELSALLGIFLSNSRWGVIIGIGFFPVGMALGFLRASMLWKSG